MVITNEMPVSGVANSWEETKEVFKFFSKTDAL